jgi:hypothetical protein
LEHLRRKTYKSEDVNSEWDLLALISVDSQNNLQVIYMRWIQLGVFILSVGHTLQGIMEIRAMGI